MKLIVALVLVGAFTACTSTPRPTVSLPTDDAGRARLLVVTQADLPAGWQASTHHADLVADREDRRLATCMGAPDPGTAQTADVFGDEFSQGAQAISSEAVFFRSAAVATKAAAALRGAHAVPCARASVRPVVVEQLRLQGIKAAIRSIAVTRYAVNVEDFVSAFRVVVVLATTGASITVQRDVVVLGRGRAQVRAIFLDVGRAFSSNLELSLVKALSGKLLRK